MLWGEFWWFIALQNSINGFNICVENSAFFIARLCFHNNKKKNLGAVWAILSKKCKFSPTKQHQKKFKDSPPLHTEITQTVKRMESPWSVLGCDCLVLEPTLRGSICGGLRILRLLQSARDGHHLPLYAQGKDHKKEVLQGTASWAFVVINGYI